MVSSALKMELDDLLDTLTRFRHELADDAEYQRLRDELPADWPM